MPLHGERVPADIALLYCNRKRVAADTKFRRRVSMVVSILFQYGNLCCGH